MIQPQQTIGNTVYRVGQVLSNFTEAAALLDYMEGRYTTYNFFYSPLKQYLVQFGFYRPRRIPYYNHRPAKP